MYTYFIINRGAYVCFSLFHEHVFVKVNIEQ